MPTPRSPVMMRSRVVARAARTLLLVAGVLACTSTPAASPIRLDLPNAALLPGLGHLMAPSAVAWPKRFEPQAPLGSLRRVTATPAAVKPAPALSAAARRDLGRRIATTLSRYKRLFVHAARANDLPAGLIAAVSYLESKWQPSAHHRGVAGMMMLSSTAARQVGVSDRLSARESVHGGARYLALLRNRLSRAIPLPDRNYFALAAYNMGIGHLRDAQALARRLGRNPHLWSQLKQVIPMLSKRRYYRHAEHGYARGEAVVAYIQRVRGCQAIIAPHLD